VNTATPTCFYETDPSVALPRRAAAEGVGTMLLVFAVSATGIAATRIVPTQPLMVELLVAVAVAGALLSLIIAFGKVSGGHYNPLITILQMLVGERSLRCTVAYVIMQLLGGVAGGLAAAALWHVTSPTRGGMGWAGFASEFIASAGLMLVVLGSSRSGRGESGPFAVGAWLLAAVVATPTNSYANPAVVIGAVVTAGPVALGRGSILPYISAELCGAVLALGIIFMVFPGRRVLS
jgi:glycerol uptake facilitator-like aquaporin